MPSPEDSQRSTALETPTPSSSPILSQMTPSTHQDKDRPMIRLIPPPSFTSTGAHSFAPSSSTSVSTMPTPIDPISSISLAAQPHSPSIEGWEDLSSSVIDSYDLTTLREKLKLANQHIKALSSSIISLRTNSAHYLLQHKILEMETTEAAARHQVESEITRREVEVLRLDQSSFSTTQQLALAEENEAYKRRLRKAKRSIRDYREELGDFKNENERLKKRIRDNRQHQLDASRSPDDDRHGAVRGRNGDEDGDYSGVHNSTAVPEKTGPVRRASAVVGRGTAEDDGLEALRFLASQVLSQEMDEDTCHVDARRAITPQPKLKKPIMSDSTHHSTHRTLMSPVAFTSSSTSRSKKRRHSRDSTISASDIDDVSDINESGKRRRTGSSANNLHHSITRQRRCTHSPHPTPAMSLINEHRNNWRHHADAGANTSSLRTLPPGTPVSPPGRDGKVRDVGSGLGLGLKLGLGSEGIRSPP